MFNEFNVESGNKENYSDPILTALVPFAHHILDLCKQTSQKTFSFSRIRLFINLIKKDAFKNSFLSRLSNVLP